MLSLEYAFMNNTARTSGEGIARIVLGWVDPEDLIAQEQSEEGDAADGEAKEETGA